MDLKRSNHRDDQIMITFIFLMRVQRNLTISRISGLNTLVFLKITDHFNNVMIKMEHVMNYLTSLFMKSPQL